MLVWPEFSHPQEVFLIITTATSIFRRNLSKLLERWAVEDLLRIRYKLSRKSLNIRRLYISLHFAMTSIPNFKICRLRTYHLSVYQQSHIKLALSRNSSMVLPHVPPIDNAKPQWKMMEDLLGRHAANEASGKNEWIPADPIYQLVRHVGESCSEIQTTIGAQVLRANSGHHVAGVERPTRRHFTTRNDTTWTPALVVGRAWIKVNSGMSRSDLTVPYSTHPVSLLFNGIAE